MILVFIVSCGRNGEDLPAPTPLQEMFQKGRLHRFFQAQTADSFNLVHREEIVQWQQLGDSPYASWIQFDTRLMPDLERSQLMNILPWVVQNYGAMLADLKLEEWLPSERAWRRDESRLFLNYSRRVLDRSVRDNVLQLIVMEVEPGIFRLGEIQSNITGPAPLLSEKKAPADAEWLADLTGRSDLEVQETTEEWIPFLEAQTFHWERATVFEWLMEGQFFRATLLMEQGRWLDAYPLAVHAKPILTKALKRSYADEGPREYPLSFSATTGASGNYILGAEAWLPNGFSPLTVSLNGPRATVIDNQSPKQLSYENLQEQESSFLLPDDPTRLAAVNAFVAVQRINRFARQFLSHEDTPFLNQSLLVNVNLADQSCNAFYSPKQKGLLLYREGGGCANMALLNDVIYHEWGHALDDHVGRTPGITDPAFSEGMADVTAAYFNSDPSIAPFFYFDNAEPIRRLTNDRQYPRDVGQMHFEGGIISSTFWELRTVLIDRYGVHRGAHLAGRLFFRHLLAVDSYLESYAAVLRVDDDDNNPATPSPNHCLINGVFARHGLAVAEYCEDQPLALTGTTAELTLALLDAGPEENAVHVVASAVEADGLVLCMKARAVCLQNQTLWVPLQKISSETPRSFFMSSSPLLLPPLSIVTLIRIDMAGQIRDSRELKIFAK